MTDKEIEEKALEEYPIAYTKPYEPRIVNDKNAKERNAYIKGAKWMKKALKHQAYFDKEK